MKNVKPGDIVIVSLEETGCSHAKMCYRYDKVSKRPLFLGFTPLDDGINARDW